MNDKSKKYYEYLKSKGVDVAPTFESFTNTLQDDNKRKKYYEYLQTKDIDLAPSFESFTNTLVVKKKSKTQPQEEATTSVSETPSTPSYESGERTEETIDFNAVKYGIKPPRKTEQQQDETQVKGAIASFKPPSPLELRRGETQEEYQIRKNQDLILQEKTKIDEQINSIAIGFDEAEKNIQKLNALTSELNAIKPPQGIPTPTQINSLTDEITKTASTLESENARIEKKYSSLFTQLESLPKNENGEYIIEDEKKSKIIQSQLEDYNEEIKPLAEQQSKLNEMVAAQNKAVGMYNEWFSNNYPADKAAQAQQLLKEYEQFKTVEAQGKKRYEELAKESARLKAADFSLQAEKDAIQDEKIKQFRRDIIQSLPITTQAGMYLFGALKMGSESTIGGLATSQSRQSNQVFAPQDQTQDIDFNAVKYGIKPTKEQDTELRKNVYEWGKNMYDKSKKTESDYGLVASLSEVDNPLDLLSFALTSVAEQAPQIPLAIATFGGSTYFQELGGMQQEIVQGLMDERGMSLEEALNSDEANNVATNLTALGIASLDMLGLVGQFGGKVLLGNVIKSGIKQSAVERIALGVTGELATETGQEVLAKGGTSQAMGDGFIEGAKSITADEVKDLWAKVLFSAGTFTTVNTLIEGKVNADNIETLNAASTDSKVLSNLTNHIQSLNAAGVISTEEADRQIAELNAKVQSNLQIPDNIQGEKRAKLVELQQKYNEVSENQKRASPAFKQAFKQNLDDIQAQMEAIIAESETTQEKTTDEDVIISEDEILALEQEIAQEEKELSKKKEPTKKEEKQESKTLVTPKALDFLGKEVVDENGNVGTIKQEGEGRLIFESDNRILELGSADNVADVTLAEYGLSVKPEEITEGTTIEKKQTKEGQKTVPQTKTEGAEATTDAIIQEQEYLEKTEKELSEMEKKAEEDVKAFEELVLEEAAKKSTNKDLVQVGDNIFQVTKKDDGTFTVSQMREDGRLVPIGEKNTNRNKAIGAFKSKKSNTERRALAEAQKLVDDFRKSEQDKILNWLDQAIAATSNQGRAFDATIGIPLSMLNGALKIIKAAYKAGKSLTEAIQDAIEHLKKQGYSPNELEFKKRILKDLKEDATKQQSGQVRKQGVQDKKKGSSDKDMPKGDKAKLQDRKKKTTVESETQGLTEKERTKQGVEELVTAIKEKSRERLSNVTNRFKEEIKRRAKTLKDFKDRKKAIEDFAKDLLKELKKSGVKYIPTRKAQSIINSISAAKTDKSLNNSAQKLIDTVNKIAVTDEEVKQRAKINKLKRQAKKNRKTKAGQLSNEINTILSLDDVPPSLQEEYESVLEQIGQRAAILSIDDISAIKELARKIDEEYKVEETISEEEESETAEKEDKQEELDSAELELKLIPDDTDLGSRDKNNAAYSFKKLTKEFLETLPKATLKNIAKEARNIQNGFMSNGFVEAINNKFEGFQKGKDIAKNKSAITNSNNKFKNAIKKANSMANKAMRTQLNHIDAAFKSIKNTSLYENLVSPLTRAFQQSSIETKEFIKDITSLSAKAISSRNRLRRLRDNTEAKFRLNVILDLFLIDQQHQQNPDSKLTPSSQSIIETINKDVNEEGSRSGYTEKDLSIINDVYNNAPKNPDGTLNLEEYKNKYLTQAERNLLEYIEDTYIKYQDKAIYVSEQLRGETLEMFNAYAPRNTVTQKEMTTAEKMDAWKGKTKQASSTKKRSETAPLVRLGGVTNAIGYVSEINEDYYVTKAVRQVDATLKYLKENLEGDNKKFAQQLQNFMDNHVREQYEKIHQKDNQGERLLKEVVRGVYSNLLVNFFGRLPKEFASNLAVGTVETKNFIRSSKNPTVGFMLKNTPKLMRKFGSAHLDRVGNLTLDLREVEGSPIGRGFRTTNIGTFEKFNDVVANNIVKDMSKLANKLYYSLADIMLRPAWSFELMAEFKKETGQELNSEKLLNDDKYYLDNKQAIDRALARADKHVSDLYNTASQFERRLDQKQAKSTFKQMTKFFMQSFSFNENSVMSSAAKSTVGQGNMGHQEAAAKLTAVIARMMIYSGWSSVLASIVYGIFGDDDEELKDVVELFGGEREYSDKIVSDFLLKGGADILGIALFGKQVAWAKTGINTALNGALEGYEKITEDSRFKTSKGYYPFFGVNYNNVGYRDMGRFLGGLGTFATTSIDLGVNTIKVTQKIFEGEEPTDKQKLKLQLSGMALLAAMLGLPLAKDAEKFIKRMNEEQEKPKPKVRYISKD